MGPLVALRWGDTEEQPQYSTQSTQMPSDAVHIATVVTALLGC